MKFVKSDITKAEEEHIIHGCNAQGVMGAGVAKAIREAFPGCYEDYKKRVLLHWDMLNGYWKDKHDANLAMLGQHFSFYHEDSRKTIHNLITQIDYDRYRTGGKFASYLAIVKGLQSIVRYNFAVDKYAISRIGCSLGGLDWQVVEPLIREVEEHERVEFTVYEV